MTKKISIVTPCFNEELNIPHALKSVADWADEVHVLDSESTDRTREIAAEPSHGWTVTIAPCSARRGRRTGGSTTSR